MTNPTNPGRTDSDLLAYRDPALLQIESSLELEWAKIVRQANVRLDSIIQNFRETGSVTDKNHDDLFFELGFENDWAFNDDPESAIDITLLQLLQASTVRLQAGSQDADQRHIHHLIEHAFIEQEGLRIISELWQVTGNGDFTEEHYALLDAATHPYLTTHGKLALDSIADQVKRLPDYRDSPFLHFGKSAAMTGDPPTEAAFNQALAYLEAITDHFLEFDTLWDKTPADLAYELAYHNGWCAFEVKERGETFEETSLQALLALSRRRLLAFAETGWNLTHYEQIVRFVDGLIEKALSEDLVMKSAIASAATLKSAASSLADELSSGK